MSADSELTATLRPGERVDAVVFGEWGWGRGAGNLGYGEPDPPPVPFDKRGTVLTWDEAHPMMQTWSFNGGFGAPHCYAVRIWTNERVFWVTQYDGSTRLSWAERNPVACDPDMPGG